MKKYAFILIFLTFLLYTMINTESTYAVNVFKEGIYKAQEFNFSPQSLYRAQNISNQNVHIFVFDENQVEIQSMRLMPSSRSYNLVPLKPSYRIAIVGNGEVFISS